MVNVVNQVTAQPYELVLYIRILKVFIKVEIANNRARVARHPDAPPTAGMHYGPAAVPAARPPMRHCARPRGSMMARSQECEDTHCRSRTDIARHGARTRAHPRSSTRGQSAEVLFRYYSVCDILVAQ